MTTRPSTPAPDHDPSAASRGQRDAPVVLITGASGRIGSRAARRLAPTYRVIGLDNSPPDRGAPIEHVDCDLTDDAAVERALATVRSRTARLASVVHLAAHYDFSGEPSPLYDALTVDGTGRVLSHLDRFEQVDQFVFSSSMLVMRPAPRGRVIDEDGELDARWPYPRSKIAAERLLRRRHHRLPVVVLRIAGVYDDDGHSIPLAQQARRIHEKKLESYLFPGDPRNGQSFVHVDDVADCIRATVDRRRDLGQWEVFLVGEPDNLSYRQLQARMGQILHGRPWPTLRIPAALAKAGAWLKAKVGRGPDPFIKPWMVDLADANYPLSIARAEQRLGWRPRHRLDEQLPQLLSGLKQRPREWYATNGLAHAGS